MFMTRVFFPAFRIDKTWRPVQRPAIADRAYVTTGDTEVCRLCGCDTRIAITTPIGDRWGYVIGVGQLCQHCG